MEKRFSRCAGEGLIPTLAARDGEEALLPFTGEGARRADEGARAQRSVLLMLPGRARAARCARALIRRCAPPSPAAQEKGWVPTLATRHGTEEALLPFTGEGARRADEGARAERRVPLILAWEGQQQLAALAPSSGAARHLLPLRRRRADPEPRGESWEGSPSPAAHKKGSFRTERQGPDGEALSLGRRDVACRFACPCPPPANGGRPTPLPRERPAPRPRPPSSRATDP